MTVVAKVKFRFTTFRLFIYNLGQNKTKNYYPPPHKLNHESTRKWKPAHFYIIEIRGGGGGRGKGGLHFPFKMSKIVDQSRK